MQPFGKNGIFNILMNLRSLIIITPAIALLGSCSPARSVLNSGKVVPKKQVRIGLNYTFNVSTAPIQQTYNTAFNAIKNYANDDSIRFEDKTVTTVQDANAALLAYCLDPITMTDDLYFRIGLGHRMDMGYKTSGGAHAVDVMYQFLGSNENFNTSDYRGYYGSVGLQYAHKSYDFSNNPILKKMQKVFIMDMNRKEITLPVIFSKTWGPEERVGCFSFGFLYSHTFIKYKIATKNVYRINDEVDPEYKLPPELLTPVEAKVHYGSYGTFINMKVGKKFVYFNLSLAAYYQNYGRYPLLGGGSVELKGWSFVPSYGVQFNILGKQKKKAVDI